MSSTGLQAKLLREYYKSFSKYAKGKCPERKVAWVTAFSPVEILEALDIEYIYPESYAAVIAASGKGQITLMECVKNALSLDCCSYSCCIEGSLSSQGMPRGTMPTPDVLIATNNQCNTLPGWWNMFAQKLNVPLIVLDYPGEHADGISSFEYVTAQHKDLIIRMEQLSGNVLSETRLSQLLDNSANSVAAWTNIDEMLPKYDIPPTQLFDGISFLITARPKSETAELYTILADELTVFSPADTTKPALFWLGYPLWYHPKRYLSELLEDVRICGSNYTAWWNLDYSGGEPFERLYNAYNFTFLNLTRQTRYKRLSKCIADSGAVGAITLRNKSCKCDFVSARDVNLPQAELEIDMIDSSFLDVVKAKRQIEQLLECL